MCVAAIALLGASVAVVAGPAAPSGAVGTLTGGGSYVPLPSVRVADSRHGPHQQYVAPGGTGYVGTVGGGGGLPASSSEGGTVLLNVTVTDVASDGYLLLWQQNGPRPRVSSLNFTAHRTTAGLVAVHYSGYNASIVYYNASGSSASVIVDVEGYYDGVPSTAPGRFVGVQPARLFDSRASSPVAAGGAVSVPVLGRAGLPATGISAVLVDLVAAAPPVPGYLTAWADGLPAPHTSTLNFAAHRTTSNTAVVPVGADGRIALRNGSGAALQVVVDVMGYFVPGSPDAPGATGVVVPSRVLDTRYGTGTARGAVAAGHSVTLTVAGRGGLPAAPGSVALNLVATGATGPGFVSVRAGGSPPSRTSSINYVRGDTVTNLVVAPVGPDGTVVLTVGGTGSVQLVADVEAYSLPATVVTGRVTDTAGHPARGAEVVARLSNQDLVSTAPDPSGRFVLGAMDGLTVTSLCAEVVVSAETFPGSLGSGCWKQVDKGEPPTPITPVPGQTVTTDLVLGLGGAISGTVTDPAGHPVATSEGVSLAQPVATVGGGTAGSFFIGGLNAASYTLCLSGGRQSGAPYGYLPLCFDGQPGDPAKVGVTAGAVTPVNAVMHPGGQLAGTFETVIDGVRTTFYGYVSLTGPGVSRQLSAHDHFAFDPLASGDYTVCVTTSYAYVVPGCYGGATGTPVAVTEGASTSVDFVLPAVGTLSGTVEDSTGAPVVGASLTVTSDSYTATTTTLGGGAYALRRVPPGPYTVCVRAAGHADQCYDGATDPAGATPVTVVGGHVTSVPVTLV